MIILLSRYASDFISGCAATMVMNCTQESGITSAATIGRLNGRHPNQEQSDAEILDEGAEITNAVAVLVDAGIAAGTPGNYIASEQIEARGVAIPMHAPVLTCFNVNQRQDFVTKINQHGNSFFFLYANVTLDGGDEKKHWIGCWRRNNSWFISGGEKSSRLYEVAHTNLQALLFTLAGRRILSLAIVEAWPDDTVIDFDEDSFITMPTIQLKDVKNWDNIDVDTIRNSTPWPKVRSRKEAIQRVAYHTLQIIDTSNPRVYDNGEIVVLQP